MERRRKQRIGGVRVGQNQLHFETLEGGEKKDQEIERLVKASVFWDGHE